MSTDIYINLDCGAELPNYKSPRLATAFKC